MATIDICEKVRAARNVMLKQRRETGLSGKTPLIFWKTLIDGLDMWRRTQENINASYKQDFGKARGGDTSSEKMGDRYRQQLGVHLLTLIRKAIRKQNVFVSHEAGGRQVLRI